MSSIKVRAVFTGQNGSCGYIKGSPYILRIWHQYGLIYILRGDNTGKTNYESIIAFLNNWDDIVKIN